LGFNKITLLFSGYTAGAIHLARKLAIRLEANFECVNLPTLRKALTSTIVAIAR
jgi:hypothetical protein